MKLYSTYKAYISRSNKVLLNSLTIVFAVISILFARDESMIILPLTVCTMAYVAVAGVVDFFQFGGIFSKKGNIPESVLCAFKGKELRSAYDKTGARRKSRNHLPDHEHRYHRDDNNVGDPRGGRSAQPRKDADQSEKA